MTAWWCGEDGPGPMLPEPDVPQRQDARLTALQLLAAIAARDADAAARLRVDFTGDEHDLVSSLLSWFAVLTRDAGVEGRVLATARGLLLWEQTER